MENIKKYFELVEKAREKAETLRTDARQLESEIHEIVTKYNFRDLKDNAEAWKLYKEAGEKKEKKREAAKLYDEIAKSATNDCMRYVLNLWYDFSRENIEIVDGMKCRYKKASELLQAIAGDEFDFTMEYSGMFYAIYCKKFDYSTKETVYNINDGYNLKTGKYDAFFEKEKIINAKNVSIVGVDNIEKTVKQAFKDAKKIKAMIEKFKKEAGEIKGKYNNNSIYHIFEREIIF